jgi:hypothetical protein
MKLRLSRPAVIRLALLLAASGVTASLVGGREPVETPTVEAVSGGNRPAASADAKGAAVAAIDLDAMSRPVAADVKDNLFYIPPPPVPPPVRQAPAPTRHVEAPPPKPTAPPLPFKFIGRLIDKGTTFVFVSHNGQSLNLKLGDTAADVYRVERITTSEVVFLYEPLGERQVMTLEAVN